MNAKSRAKDGDFSQLKIFQQKRLALPWTESQEVIDTNTKEVDGHIIGQRWDKLGYLCKNGEIIDKEHHNFKSEVLKGALPLLFMAVDVQQDRFYYSIRAYGKQPQDESMLIECGVLYTWQDVFDKRNQYNILGTNMGIDSGYRAKEVYALTVENRCFAMKGHEQRGFKREVGKAIGRKIYESHAVSQPQSIQVQTMETLANGQRKTRVKKALLLSFSSNAAKDWLFYNRQRTQRGKAHFDIPNGTPNEYNEQMNSEKRIKEGRYYMWRPRKAKIDNHFLDTEAMCYALCLNLLLTNENNSLLEYLT